MIYTIKWQTTSNKLYIEKKIITRKARQYIRRRKKRSIQQMQREIGDLKHQVSSSVLGYVSTVPRYHIIQVKTHGTIIGGRNEQSQHHRNMNWQFSDQYFASVKNSIRMRIWLVSANNQQPEPGIPAANECDTNADTCCLGSNFIVL